jgi:hypothetical protein
MACADKLTDSLNDSVSLPEHVDFNFHIKPILSDRCFTCHGPDEGTRKADLRLDLEKEAFARLKSGHGRAFHPRRPDKSESLKRMKSDDPDYQMPPPESNLSLSDQEIALLEKWIDQGAEWKKHWSFIPPQKVKIPDNHSSKWIEMNDIDHFVLNKAQEYSLEVSESADPARLVRRVYMDITGLPPSVEVIDKFVADPSFEAYENIVDYLLTTEAHAERMSMEWMDVARYADSHGLHADGWRNMHPWRDWVIRAFHNNMSFEDFITKQLAGDMLPNSSRDDIIATAFNRNHPMTAEGGAVDEEWRLNYVFDRTETMSTALLGLTVGCAKCHDHKYDPISQKEYYELASFFNNVKEVGMTGDDGNYGPILMLTDDITQSKIDELNALITSECEKIKVSDKEINQVSQYISNLSGDADENLIAHISFENRKEKINNENGRRSVYFDGNKKYTTPGEGKLVGGKYGKSLLFEKDFSTLYLADVGQFENTDAFSASAWIFTTQNNPQKTQTIMGNSGEKNNFWRGWDLYLDEDNRLNARLISALPHNYLHVRSASSIDTSEWTHVALTYDGSSDASGLNVFINGSMVSDDIVYNDLTKSTLTVRAGNHTKDNRSLAVGVSGRLYTGEDGLFYGRVDEIKIHNIELSPYEVNLSAGIDVEVDDQSKILIAERRLYPKVNSQIKNLRKEKLDAYLKVPEMMVMSETEKPNQMYIYHRGEYDKPTDEVSAATPSTVLAFPKELEVNRLGLAQWIFHRDNPLTARVAVNRYWQMIFGSGLVSTPEDFGMQGALPSHPDLLDHLALELVESDWNLRTLIKKMVMSATYRQTSIATEEARSIDPENVYLARGRSYRLSAEMIRDNALSASGLLETNVGGASVRPYQPEGLWIELGNFSHKLLTYKATKGDSLYRRSMYTFVRRTSPHPMMTTFDAPSREVCTMKRENTNTPLQALVLLNDPQFVEASKVLAQKMQYEGGNSLKEQINYAFKSCTGRGVMAEEERLLIQLYNQHYEIFSNSPNDAEKLLGVGEYVLDKNLDKIKTASLAMVSNTILNHDDAYMKR